MESMNYTYERKPTYRTNEVIRINYQAWVILNPKGRKIAEATSEATAALIVSALNGVAV